MRRWVFRIIVIGILGYAAYVAYHLHRAGYLSLPDIPDGAYTLSFPSGLRAIVLDADVSDTTWTDAPEYFRSLSRANPDRKHLGVPLDVQPWFKEAWSWCKSPTQQEKAYLEQMPDDFQRSVENARFEAVCRFDVDGTEVLRGLIFSVPRL